MMRKLLILTLGVLALTIPTLASANHVTGLTGNADCDGWNLCATVYFLPDAIDGSLDYSVTLLDGDNEVITSFDETLVIFPEEGGGYTEYCYSGFWDGNFQVSGGNVAMTAALNGDNPTEYQFDLECTVANENISFDTIKSMYR